MVAHSLRRWPNIVPTLGERLVFAGIEVGDVFVRTGDMGDRTALVLCWKFVEEEWVGTRPWCDVQQKSNVSLPEGHHKGPASVRFVYPLPEKATNHPQAP